MRILVTGGAGFVGSHLVDAFLDAGHEVVVVDNFITGNPDNLAHRAGDPRFLLVNADISAGVPAGLPSFDLICHLASPASPVGYGANPLATMQANGFGTYHLLERCRADGARFLLASTSEIYGDPEVHPQTEDYWGNVNPIGPRSCYDESKRFAEAMAKVYGDEYGVDFRIVRIFNTYGPRNAIEDGRIIPNFVCQAIEGRPLTVFGDGAQTRSYCYVSDLVRGLVALATRDGLAGQVVNLGNPTEYGALEMAQAVIRLAGSTSPIDHLPPRPEEIARRRPDISRARALLGWEPEVGLEEGLARTIAWYRERLAVPADPRAG